MKKIIISTESVADLPSDVIEKHQIQIIPMHIIIDGKDHLETELSVEDVFSYYNETKKIPSTTATNAEEYRQLFSKIRNEFPDSIIVHLGYTSKSSASFQSAVIASEDFEDLYLIDTLNVTGGLAAIVMYAVSLLEQEPTISHLELIEKIKAVIPKTKLAFIPNTLEFLKAGGRVSNIAFIGGSLLKIKPCIEIKDGKLRPSHKYRGNMNIVAKKLMHDYLSKYNINRKHLCLIYSVGLDEAIKVQVENFAKEEGFEQITWIQASATISTHAGPGCFGIAGIEY